MQQYSHLLVGLDLSKESELIAEKACALAKLCNAKISFVHVIEPLTFAYAGDIPVDLTETQASMEKHATERLSELCSALNCKPENVQVIIGPTADTLRECAADLEADLIVVGSHGRHGLALILGSTASDVLHGAKCDVLAIRV